MLQDRPESQVKADIEAARQTLRERLLAGGLLKNGARSADVERKATGPARDVNPAHNIHVSPLNRRRTSTWPIERRPHAPAEGDQSGTSRRRRRPRRSWRTWSRCGAGRRAPSSSGMSTSTCSSGPVPISRTTGSGPSATWPRSGVIAHSDFARSLLPVLDNLQRALAASWKQADKDPLIQGVDLVRSQMLELFGRFGITPINALDQPFDPHVHEAVQQLPRDDVSPGTVVEVLEPGYLLHERVLRRPGWAWPRPPPRHPRRPEPGGGLMPKTSESARASESQGFEKMFAPGRLTLGVFFPIEAYQGRPADDARPGTPGPPRRGAGIRRALVPGRAAARPELRRRRAGLRPLGLSRLDRGADAHDRARHRFDRPPPAAPVAHCQGGGLGRPALGGRLVLGVASGDRPVEFPAFGVDYEERDVLFRENLRVIREVLAEEFPKVRSSYGTLFGTADLVPKPDRPAADPGDRSQPADSGMDRRAFRRLDHLPAVPRTPGGGRRALARRRGGRRHRACSSRSRSRSTST